MKRLKELTEQQTYLDYGIDNLEGEIYQKYSLETEAGLTFYETIEDSFLVHMRRKKQKN